MYMKILIVDDDESIVDWCVSFFNFEKWECIECISYDEADIFLDDTIDVLISDLNLNGFSGLKLCEKAKKIKNHMITILMSGYFEKSYLHNSNINILLKKPFNGKALLHTIKEEYKHIV